MKAWKIPVEWAMAGIIEVKAETLAKAIQIAKDEEELIPLPDDGEYIDDSWKLNCEDEEVIRKFYNNNQNDE
mgnify:CR=1 FL=1